MNLAYLQLGSNLGDRLELISNAVKCIKENVGTLLSFSKIYLSTPWRVEGQQSYLNQIIEIETNLSAEDLLISVLKIEKDLGRVRIEKWGERLIDIDIIFFNDEIIETPNLCIPHKHMHERNFVLIPLNEIIPFYIHPKYNKTVSALLEQSKDSEKVIEYVV
tara:strand:- start:85 stop:570 length:486 start_codon:yes stop_codon:yes gene_type:complete